MQAHDVMTRPVISIDPNDTVERAVRLMLQHRISGLPVIDSFGRLQGMVTEGDFLRRAEIGTQRSRPRWLEFILGPGRLADEYVHTHGRKIREVMTCDPVTVSEDTPLEQVVAIMEKRQIKRVPVLRDGEVVGIISRANLLHALASVASEMKPTEADDHTIRERVLAEFQRHKWAPVGTVDVIVRDGVVELWGTVLDDRERQAMIVAAENVPGVKRVIDQVEWLGPVSAYPS